jgi:hypothetical protein
MYNMYLITKEEERERENGKRRELKCTKCSRFNSETEVCICNRRKRECREKEEKRRGGARVLEDPQICRRNLREVTRAHPRAIKKCS